MNAATNRRPMTTTPAYLKAIYRLHESDAPVTTRRIAAQLHVADPSVSKMIRRLHGLGLVRHTRYHGVELTARGQQIAVETIRHHRLLERYLVEKSGYALDEVHAEAEVLEHYLSAALETQTDKALGFPGRPVSAPASSVA